MIRDKLTLCLFGISACFVAVAVARLDGEGIVGGDLANEEHEFPYQVSLQIQGQHFCGGALLGNRHVLTAAHCVTKSTNGDWSSTAKYGFDVVAGTQDLDEAASRRSSATKEQVAKIYILNGYKPQKGSNVNDIAVLKLKNPVDLSSRSNKLGKVELPKPQNTYAGEEAVISGFGYDWAMVMSSQQEIGGNSDRHLRWAKADVISNAQCNRYYRRDPVSEEQICASVKQRSDTKGSGVCSGDSGGPLVHGDKTIIGVVSTSPLGCTEKYVPAVYTRVSSFVNFIKNAVNGKKTEDMRVLEIIKTSDDYETVEPTTRRPYHRLTTRRPFYDEPSIPSWEKWFGNSFGGFWG